jgi:tripeptide aminopeptidase
MIDRERLLARFLELCAINSESTRERQMADRLTVLLTSLGCSVVEDDTGTRIGGTAGNLVACLPGTGPGAPLLFSCHMDRVVPGIGVRPRLQDGHVVSDGTTVLGADDAAGLAALLEALTALRETGTRHPPLEIVLTVAEELALAGSRHLDTATLKARCGFFLDCGGPVGEIVLRAPEQTRIRALFHGRSAHAGFAPEEGVSAIQMAAAAICRMKLLRIDAETTANVGSIAAAGPTNIVCDRCELEAEARSLDPAKLQAQVTAMTAALEEAAAEAGGSVEIEIIPCYPSYRLAEDAEPARRAAAAAHRLGLPGRFKSTGGGSDANIFNSRGIPSVVLSCGYEQVHTLTERIAVEQLELLAAWTFAIIADGVAS